jgi:soluble lytic murein transglycosylase-like protein
LAQILTIPSRIPAASGIPNVEPQSRPPEDYERIASSGADFGAQVGAAEEKVGQDVLKVGHVYGQLSGQQAASGYMDESQQVMTDYLGKHNQEAMDAQPGVIAALKALRDKYAGMGMTTDSQIEFNQQTRYLMARQQGEIGTHYDTESKGWGTQVSETRYQNAIADAATHPEDEGAATQALATANSARIQKMQLAGLLPRDVSQLTPDQAALMAREQRQALTDVTEARIKAAAISNPALATKLYTDHTDILSTSKNYDSLGYSLAGHAATAQRNADRAQAAAIVDRMSGGAVPGTTGPRTTTGPLPALPQAPAQYAPLINGAATQYDVPEELLTRVLFAENGFKPTGVSPKGARGIAQFLPSTAASRGGFDPDDPTQAIPQAARYLADLKATGGTWNAALRGYLGGDPHKDASYTRAGVPQLADALDRGVAPGAPNVAPGAQGGAQNLEVWGDSLGVGLNVPLRAPGHVHGGDTPQTIFDTIKGQPEDHWQGKTVVLPSGSNGQQMPVVEQTIDYLKAHGANVIAVGYGPKFPEKNAELADIAKRQGVPVIAAEDVGATEGVHPSPHGYSSMGEKIRALTTAAPAPAAGKVNPPVFDTQHAAGMVKPGNVDPWNRAVLHNPDGSYSTTSSMSIGTGAGEVLIPTVMGHPAGRLSNEDAIAHFKATGENLGTFSTPAAADAYATLLHNAQASMYDAHGNPKAAPPPDQLVGQPAAPATPMTAPVPNFPTREEYLARIPEGLSEEQYSRVYGMANQRYGRMVQTTSADRSQALAQYKGGVAMLQDGREFNYDPNTYRRLFPKENADQMIGDLEDARTIGQQVQAVRGMPLTEIATQHAANQAVLARSAGPGYVKQKKLADAFDKAVEQHIKALGEDPASYVLATNPDVEAAREATAKETLEQSAELRGQGIPDAVESFAAKLLGEQERLQVPADSRHVLSNTQAQSATQQIMADPEHAPAALKAMQERWGTAWPEVWRDIVSVGKLPPAYQMVGALDNEGDGALLARGLAEANKAGVNKSLDDLLDAKVAGALKPSMTIATRIAGDDSIKQYERSMLNSGASPRQVDGIISAIGLLAKAKALYHGEDPAAAADHAVESAIGKWEFMPNGGARVPRSNVDAISAAAQQYVNSLTLNDVQQPLSLANRPDIAGAVSGDDWLRILKAAPNWITVGQSIRLMDSGGRFVRQANGGFIEVPFNAKPDKVPDAPVDYQQGQF